MTFSFTVVAPYLQPRRADMGAIQPGLNYRYEAAIPDSDVAHPL
jgi:hypothetical protein